jgi:hypothetical protein
VDLECTIFGLPAAGSLFLGSLVGFFLSSLGSCFYEILKAHHFGFT